MAERSFILGVDCDGVLADYFRGIRNYIAEQINVSRYSLPIPVEYDFTSDPMWRNIVPDRDTFLEYHNAAVADGLFKRLPVIPWAMSSMWTLSDAGVYLRIITHRFHKHGTYAKVVSDTVKWLDDCDIPYRGLSVERWKSDVNCDLYIDDSPTNVQELRAAGNDCIVFDAPYNQNVPGLRARGWEDAVEIIMQRVKERGI